MKSKTLIKKNKEVTYLEFEIFEEYKNLISVYSSRIGGVSKGVFSSMNLGFSRGDIKEDVDENYKIFSKSLNISYEDMVLSDQWHHTNILEVDESHKGMGIIKERSYEDVDGLITNKANIPLVTFYADCVPLYFYDEINKVIGMAHSGWRGTVLGISDVMIDNFINKYNSKIKNIKVAIGPAICKKCYEVGEDVIEGLNRLPFDISLYYDYNKEKDKYYIDLWEINKRKLVEKGILEKNISVSDYCTKCKSEMFFSHRKHGNDRGTQIGVMMLKE